MTQTPPADPQAGDAGNEPQPQAGTTPQTEPQAGDSHEPMSLDEAKKLRSEAQALRKREKEALARLTAYEQKEKEAQDAQLPELERLKKQVADAEQVHTGLIEQLVDREVRLQAAALGVQPQNLKHVAKLIWDDLEFDQDTGMPTNVEPLLKELLKELDLTGKRTASTGGATNPSRSQTINAGQITIDNLQEAMRQYDKLSPSQQRQVQNLLIGGR